MKPEPIGCSGSHNLGLPRYHTVAHPSAMHRAIVRTAFSTTVMFVDKKRGPEMRKFRAMVTGKDARFHGNSTINRCCNEYELSLGQVHRVPLGEAFLKNLSNREFLSVPECHDWWVISYWNVFARLKEFFNGVHGAAVAMETNYKQANWTVFEIKRRYPEPIMMEPSDTDPVPSGVVLPGLRILTNQENE